ncbi:MAG: hypothetical protein KBD64_00790 [Gammaproteobacteria bacterium]|nr:hypothetical protein [Gammaproteobacteria bacterium]
MAPQTRVLCKVIKIEQTSNTISKITLSPNARLTFMAGQYINVYLNPAKALAYSIASSPLEHNLQLLIFHGRNDENINFFRNNKSNIEISLPQGNAYYRQNKNVLLGIGKGLGIAPIRSIIDYLININSNHKVFIFYVVYTEDEIIIGKHFDQLVEQAKQSKILLDIEYKPIMINGRYDLEKVYGNLVKLNEKDLLNVSDFYVFGSNDFVMNIHHALAPFCKNNFFTDAQLMSKMGDANER